MNGMSFCLTEIGCMCMCVCVCVCVAVCCVHVYCVCVCRKKRKAAAEGDEAPPTLKKSKSEQKEEKALREQSQLVWKYHDMLKENLSKYSLQALLKANKQEIPSGEKAVSE